MHAQMEQKMGKDMETAIISSFSNEGHCLGSLEYGLNIRAIF